MRLLLASGNAHKLAELEAALSSPLSSLDVRIVSPADVGGLPAVEEDQPSFAGNAEKKARSAAQGSGLWTLADDSGLAVDALDGAPGVRSARYAGEPSDDAANNAKLLRELGDRPATERGARFLCALALVDPAGVLRASFTGEVRGTILTAGRGTSGFGYDPLFLFTEVGTPVAPGRTFAELSREEKGKISHRGRALQELARRLAQDPELLESETESSPRP